MRGTIGQKKLRQLLMAGASPAILAAHLIVVLPSQATDITISSSITTGTVWSGAGSPGSNLTVTSSGTINTANPYGVTITGTAGSTLGTLLNSGQIIDTATSGRAIFIQAGSVAAIVNTGSISGDYALWNDGSLGTLTNSGTIVGGINSTGTLGSIVNSGRILGDVSSANSLTLVGGSSGTIGTFASTGTVKNTITATSGIVIAGGSLLISDDINVGSNTLFSSGSNLTLAANTTITGNYRQTLSSNTLTTSALTVTGRMTLAGGTIIPSFSGLSNYIVGTAAGVLYSPTGITNLGAAFGTAVAPTGARFSNIGASGTTLVYFNPLMDYVGGSLASITVGSTILNGTSTIFPTALYIASTGNLGTLSNTGTIRGDIINLSTNDLNIRGGTATTIGTLTGYSGSIGTIMNTLSDINLVSGNIRLINNVNVGSNTFTNSGGQLYFNTLGTNTITGNFAQTSGVLALNNARLTVSGSASITGGTILASVISTNNYVIGDTLASSQVTLISAGAASNYNASLSSSSPGINLGSVSSGNDLVVAVLNDYIGTTYGTILNTGTLNSATAVYIASTGTLGALSNTGVIQGNIVNNSTRDLTIIGAGGTLSGTTGQGTITNTLSNVVLASGSQLLNDAINVTGHTLVNNGMALTLNTLINVTGGYAQTGGSLDLGANSGLVVSGAASISGATVTASLTATGNYLAPGGATLVAAGATSSYSSIVATSNSITGLVSSGSTVVGNNLLLSFGNNYVGGTLATLTNSGAISAPTAVYIAATGNLGTLVNSGTLAGDIRNLSANDLTIAGTGGTLTGTTGQGTIINTLSNVVLASGSQLLNNTVNVGTGTVTNAGAAVSLTTVVNVTGNYSQSAGSLILGANSHLVVSGAASITGGTIAASLGATGNYVSGVQTTLLSAGSASAVSAVVTATGITGLQTGSTLVGNNLLLTFSNAYVGGTLATLSNSDTISAATAVYIAATGNLGTLINSGTLAGDIKNLSAQDLTITGTGGTLTGTTGQGTITNTLSNVVLASGSQLLNNAVNVTGHTLVNNGTALTLNSIVNVTGDYVQTGGSLALGANSGLVISGAASITGATVTAVLSTTGNYLTAAGTTLVGAGATSSYSSIVATSNSITGVVSSGSTVVGNNLLLSFGNNYVGGTLATLTNSGTVSAATAVYIAATGNLGTIVNSGTLAGDIQNLSAQDLTITGGASGTIGTLTGQSGMGTIINTLSNLFFASGNLLLNDRIVATGRTVTNSGASLTLNSIVSITGNYAQSAGTLDLSAAGSGIVISGGASITGGTIATNLVSTGNYVVGSGGTTLVSAGAASSYTGVSITSNSLTGIGSVSNSVVGNNLLLALSNHYVGGTLGTLNNTGSVNASTALYIAATGNLGRLVNTGTLSGNIINLSSNNLTIDGGGSGTVGTLTGTTGQGTIRNTLGNVVLASGNLLLNDSIVATGHTVSNIGANVTLSTIVNVTGDYTQTSGTLGLGSAGRLVVSGAASITGGTITAAGAGLSSTSSYMYGSAGGTLVSGGVGSNYTGVSLASSGGITGLAVSGTASGTNLVMQVGNYYIGDTQTSVGNTATITGVTYGVYVASTGTLGTLSNSGTLTSSDTNGAGVSNNSTITTVVNSGRITGAGKGFGNQSTILSMLNSAGGTILGGTAAGLQNDTYLGTLTNAGYISSGSAGFANYGTMGVLANSGSINGGPQGVYLDGSSSLTSLSNSGTITASQSAVQVSGGLAVLTNSGLIGNATNAVNVAGTLGTLINQTGGTINGVDAVYVSGSLGGFANSGVIRGRINNQSANNLTITGGASGTIGTLTGQSGMGTIINTLSNLFFASGNLLLNDRIVATGRTVTNSGASLTLNSIVSITGNYAQSAGSLTVNPGASGLVVSGGASITGGTIVTGVLATGNYVVGLSTLVSAGAASNYTGVSVTGGSIAGLLSASTVSGNNLLLNFSNDYVGGTLGTLTNTGSVNAPTAVYIASTGSLGRLVNTGTLSGNIINLSSNNLTIDGGGSGTVGTLTGTTGQGTIRNTLGNVILASGNLLLNDTVNVGSGTLVNAGASTSLTSNVNVSGAYQQTGGSLILGSGVKLLVGGAASITGGTIAASLSATGNYAPGLATTLISAGAASAVTGIVTVTGLSGLITNSTLAGNDLILTYGNHYIGGTLGSLANTGNVSAATAVYIAATGNLGSLVNTGTLSGNIVNMSSRDLTLVGGSDFGVLTGGTITNTLSNLVLASGNLALGEGVNVGSGIVTNGGAKLRLLNDVTISGGFSQTAGELDLNNRGLKVSGAAVITGGNILAGLSALDNYRPGDGQALITGGVGSNYDGVNIAGLADIQGLVASAKTSENVLRVSFLNYYVGSNLAAINNTGSLNAATAIHIASAGNLGALNNSGTITGNITNLSGNALVINGGSGSVTGTLTGRSITSTGANVVLASGNLLLGHNFNVGSNSLVNSGANVQLAGALNVTGNYSQSAGVLNVGSNVLSVSGAATVSGGTVQSTLSATGNYLVGAQGNALITGGAGSSYAGVNVRSGVTGLAASGTQVGNNLALSFTNNYVGGNLAAIDNSGSLSAPTAVYIAATGNLGALNNSGTISGNITNLSGNALVINGGAGSAGVFTGGAITSTGANVVLASGNLLLGDSVDVGSNSLVNNGASVQLAGNLNVTGNYSQTAGLLNVGSNVLSVSGAANITGGTIAANLSATGNYLVGSGGTLVSGGAGSNYGGANIVVGGLTGVKAVSSISGNNLLMSFANNYVGGNLAAIDNSGSLSAPTAVYIASTGNLGALNNSGTISGNILNLSNKALVINGGSGSAGTFTGGAITSTGANVVLASGNLLLGDSVDVGSNSLVNSGATVQLAGSLNVTGNYSQTAGLLNVGSNVLLVSGAANVNGGTVQSTLSASGNYLVGAQGNALITGGAGSSYTGVNVRSGVTGLAASGTQVGNNLVLSVANNYVGGNLAAIDNSGSLSAPTAVYIASTGNLGALNNSGTISGNILNLSNKALVINGGSGSAGTFTGGAITSTGANVVLASGNLLLGDSVNVGSNSLVNSGATVQLAGNMNVTGNYSQTAGVLNVGSGGLLVSGAANITGGTIAANLLATGNYLVGSGGTLVSGGAGSSYGGANIVVGGLTGLTAVSSIAGNSLLMSFANNYVGGNLAAINNSGSLSAATAVYIAATGNLGALNNSGTINGNILNLSNKALVVNGGSGSAGVFTGGSITSTGANVVLASGNLLLADAVNVGSNSLVNSGANVQLAGNLNVTGNYSQTAGVLNVGNNGLSVSGAANVSGGTIQSNLSATGNYLAGTLGGTLISGGAGSSYAGVNVRSGVTGLAASGTQVGNNLALSVANNYVGGNLAAINNSGSLSSATAVYIAATGNLGALNNSGTINGNILNLSNKALVINGGSGGSTGTFTGGAITSSGANVVLASGNLLLGDAVNVGSNSLVNSGANVQLAGALNVTGNYTQTSGTLAVTGGTGGLLVTGAANITGGTIAASLSATGNYLVGGSGGTLVSAGAGSSYGGANIVVGGLTGVRAISSIAGNSLLMSFANNYVGGNLAAINNSGSLSAATAVYIAATGNLGALNNSGTINGNILNLSNKALVINGGAGSTGTFTGGSITSTGANVVLASGNLLLGDAVNVGSNSLVNSANVQLAGNLNVTGNYNQTAGRLDVNGNILSVSGAASITGGTVATNLSVTGNYLAGSQTTLVAGGAGSSYAGVAFSGSVTGLIAGATTAGNNLVFAAANNYIGGSLGNLTNSGSLSAATALYIAATGSLGTLTNNGTIAGDIINLSSRELAIAGGSSAAPALLTGRNGALGRIINRSSDLRFLSGDTRLNSAIDVGTNNVVNAGATLRVDSPISITGNFTQTAGVLAFGVGSSTTYGSLLVSGTSNLSGGTVTLTPLTGTPFTSGQTYTIVQSGGAISLGNLSFTSGGFNIIPSIVSAGGMNGLIVQLQSNFTEVGVETGGVAVGTGAALDQIAALTSNNTTAVAVQTQVLTPLAQLSAPQQQEAITQLSPSQLTPQLAVVLPAPASAAVAQRQQVTSNALETGERGLAAGGPGEKGAIWGQLLGNNVWRGTSDRAAGYKGDTAGLITGVDWFATEELAVGAAFSWMRSDTDGRGPMTGSSTKINSYQLTTYATWRPEWAEGRLSAGAQIGAGYNDFNQKRYIQFLNREAKADYGGKQYLGKVDVGYDLIKWGEQVITPKWSLRSVRLVNKSYTETGAGVADLQVKGVRTDALTQELGFQAKTGFSSVLGPTTLDVETAWVHDYLQGPIATTGVLAGVTFSTTSERPAADGLAVRVGATLAQSDAVHLRIEYGGEWRQKFLSNTIMTRATIRF